MFRKALTAAALAATAAGAIAPASASAQWSGYRDDGRPRWMYDGAERSAYYGDNDRAGRLYAPRYRTRARYYHAPRRYYGYRRHRCSGTTGLVIGAMAGGLLGHSIGHRHHATGTILGAGLGALAGREIGRSTC